MTEPWQHDWGVSPAADRVWAQVCGLRPSTAGQRLFMVLQAYIDDSLDDSGMYVLAGYVASAEQWASFSREWEKMLPLGTLNERGERHFKMSEMAMSEERMSRVAGFQNIINNHVIMSVTSMIQVEDIKRAIDRLSVDNLNIDWGKMNRPLYMAYRCLMDNFHKLRIERPDWVPINEPVDFYFDETSEKKMILDDWDQYLSTRAPEFRKLYGATPRFEDDRVYLPLQAADYRAWWARKWAVEFGPLNISKGKVPFKSAEPQIHHLILWQSEDNLVQYFKDEITNNYAEFGLVLRERGPSERIDPPFPVERIVSYVNGLFARLFKNPRA